MTRTFACTVLLLGTAAAGLCQEPPPPPPIRLTLDPAATPVPALKYRLFPEVRDQNPGNAVQLYGRALNPDWSGFFRQDPKQYARLLELSEKPLRDFTSGDIKEFSFLTTTKTLKEVDRAARRPYCDWELTERLRVDGIAVLLPDVQSMRSLANLIRLRAKLQLRAGKFDEAMVSLQTGFAMARHVADGPTLIQGLVGVAIASMMLQVVDEWVNLPGAPNLYWALTELPHPLLDMRKGFEGERLYIDAILPGYREMLADPSLPPPSAQQLQKYLRSAVAVVDDWQLSDFDRGRDALLLVLRNYTQAKRMLAEHGRTPEQIEAMPALHAVFLYQVYKYDVAYDEARKWTAIPYAEAAATASWMANRDRFRGGGQSRDLADVLVPNIERIVSAPTRIERKIAALRCVEAIRLHAAANGGKLPPKLSDVAEVPIPADPWTGKPFEYQLDGERATLIGPASGAETPRATNSNRYEITIRVKTGVK
jgi:hypothetical protein